MCTWSVAVHVLHMHAFEPSEAFTSLGILLENTDVKQAIQSRVIEAHGVV